MGRVIIAHTIKLLFESVIPFSVRVAESSAEGVSIYKHDPKGKAAMAYERFTEEVQNL